MDKPQNNISGILALIAFLLCIVVVIISHNTNNEDPLARCDIKSKEYTGESSKVGVSSRKYEVVYTYNCPSGKQVVVKWENKK